jgi:hypothetical protein
MAALDLTAEQTQRIVDFETALFTAQSSDNQAGNLHARRASGGRRRCRASRSSSASTTQWT